MKDVDISQFIGFLVAIFALGYTFATFIYELFFKKKVPATPEEMRVEDELIEKILDEEAVDEEEELPVKVVTSYGLSPHPEDRFVFHSSLDHFAQKSSVDDRKLDIHLRGGEELVSSSIKQFGADLHFMKKKPVSRIQQLLKDFPSKKACIIAKEIIDPPIGFR